MKPPKSNTAHFSRKRKWFYRIVSITFIPVLIILGIELILRVFGIGYPTRYFVKNKEINVYLSNQKYGRRFFPAQLERHPFLNSFSAKKREGTYRIFVLGGSAAKGEPDYSFGFARILELMLSHQYPDKKFEIINTAMVAINSHVVHQIAKDCAKLEPDLFVVYLGNNEVVGPFGAGTVFQSFSPNLSMIRASLWIKSLRIGQLLDGFIQNLSSKEDKNRVWRGMEMFLDNRVPKDDPRLGKVYLHLEQNLDDIIDIGLKSGAGVIVCTVSTNLKDNAPFASVNRRSLSETQKMDWDKHFKTGIELERAANYAEASDKYRQAITIDDKYAELHYRLANCLMELNRYGDARKSYINARDTDTLRFRADSQINQIIRESVLEREGENVYLVDAVKAFEDAEKTTNKIPGEEFFYEHVHLNFFGSYVLAKTVYNQISAILPAVFRSNSTEEFSFLSVDQCATHLAFTLWDLNKTLGRVLERVTHPPFTNQIDHDLRKTKIIEQMNRIKDYLSPKALDLIQQVYQKALDRNPDDWMLQNNFAEFLRERGVHDRAKQLWMSVIDIVPNFADVYNNIGALLVQEGELDDAVDYFTQALDINPCLVEANINLGVVFEKIGKKDKAVKHFSEALRLQPDNEFVRGHLDKIRSD